MNKLKNWRKLFIRKKTISLLMVIMMVFSNAPLALADEPSPETYTIGYISDQTLYNVLKGYASGSQETRTIYVDCIGTGELTNLAVALSGTNAGDFIITQPEPTTLNSTTNQAIFTIKANDGLQAGTHTATVTVSASQMTDVSFTVTQIVESIPAWGYVEFGSYNNEPILWQVIHQDDDGNPLLFAENILTLKAYNSKGKTHSNTGQHADRDNLGSNNWEYSNIRQWLNSSETTISWWQNQPSADNVWANPYAAEPGFLSDVNFSQEERSLLKPVMHKSLLTDIDKDMSDGGNEVYIYNSPLELIGRGDPMSNYDNAYYKMVTDSMFLLSEKEINEFLVSQEASHGKMPTSISVEKSDFKPDDLNLSPDEVWWYWLRTPYPKSSHDALRVDIDWKITHFNVGGGDKLKIGEPDHHILAPYGVGGIVPACYLDAASFDIESGVGSDENPYTLKAAKIHTYTINFDSGGGSPVASISGVVSGSKVTEPTAPSRSGYSFGGWYKEAACVNSWDFNSDIVAADITLYAKWTVVSSGGSPNKGGTSAKSTETNVNILVNGKFENAGTATTTKQGDKTVTTVAVDETKLEKKLASEGNHTIVTIPANTRTDVMIGELNGQVIKSLEDKAAVLEIKTESAVYTLSAQQINIDAISARFGQDVKLKDIKVQIEIANLSAETIKAGESLAKKGEFMIVAPPMDFTVRCTLGDKTVELSSFNAYVERTIAIPEGIDSNKITTGIVVEPNGDVRHVPTKVVQIDGKYYAKINSLTNSTYSVIWHPVEFKDVEKHWAKDSVNDMGSRMVINGVGNGRFEPDRDITRAEFAAIIVRALGLRPGTGENLFTDVGESEWYCEYIQTATKYGIIAGYGNGKFNPMEKITREQAMVMVARAMKITGLKSGLVEDDMDGLLGGFHDSEQVASWAKENIAACIKTAIVAGKYGKMVAPKDEITRAEVAVIVRRLLQKSSLI